MAAELLAVHPVLAAQNILASVDFFRRLGFTLIFQDDRDEPKYAAVRRDSIELHLQWQDLQNWEAETDKPVYRLLVQDVDALFLEYQETLGRDVMDQNRSPWAKPGNTPWGTREFHLRDPGLNGLQFYEVL